MSTAVKLATSIIVTIVLVCVIEFVVVALMTDAGMLQIVRGMARHFFLNNSFDGFLALAFLCTFAVFVIFDSLSIICFRYGWHSVDRKIEIFEGTEGPSGPKISTRTKLAVMYPFAIVVLLLMVAAMAKRQAGVILKMGL
jgi:hypothetical protein